LVARAIRAWHIHVVADLDLWLPEPAVRTRHRRVARAAPEDLWAAASEVRLEQTRTLGRLVRWRIPGTTADQTYRGVLSSEPFTVLAEGERWSISGLVGRIWTVQRDYPRLADAEAFRTWDQPGTVRVLMAHWVQDTGDGSALVSETRVRPVDRRAGLRLRALWSVIGHFERLIGAEPLRLAAAAAERGVAPGAVAGGDAGLRRG